MFNNILPVTQVSIILPKEKIHSTKSEKATKIDIQKKINGK